MRAVTGGWATTLADFDRTRFAHDGKERAVFRRGAGPAVIVVHELPGITPEVASFARRVSDAGLTAVLPVLFGDSGRPLSPPYAARQFAWACVAREFAAFARNTTRPVTRWLRALAAHEHGVSGGPGVGAVGMCFTGGFALAMMLDERMLAPVLSQPSLPFAIGAARKSDVGLAPDDLERVRARAAGGACVLGLRFTADRLVPAERFDALRRELGDAFVAIEIDSAPGNPWGIKRLAHSVLTNDLVDEPGHPTREAREQVVAFLRTRLAPSPPAGWAGDEPEPTGGQA